MTTEPLFPRIALIGLGLIGSSLARVARREGLAGHIAGMARSEATRETALRLGFVDSVHATPLAETTESAVEPETGLAQQGD